MRNWILAVVVALAAGCTTSKTCSLIGCQDQFHAKLTSAAGSIPVGKQVVEVTADGATVSCMFEVVGPMQVKGFEFGSPCPQGLSVALFQETTCTEVHTDLATSQQCTPVPDRFYEDVTFTGRPAQLRLRVTVDGAAVVDRTIAPDYKTAQPNGAGCDPVCHQASADWMFSAS